MESSSAKPVEPVSTLEATPPTATPRPPSPPASQSGATPTMPSATDHANGDANAGATTPPFSPSSQTPVLEKEELDFAGNVEVNNDLPTEKDLKRVEDLLVLDADGQSRPFKNLYSGEGVAPRQLIIFVRHFFCGNCQEYLRTLSSSIKPDDLLSLPVPTFITVIGCGRPELIPMYIETTNCPFPVYADPTRKLYDYLGMTRTLDLGKKPEYIHSNLLFTSVQSVMQGLKQTSHALKGGDIKQVGGEFMFEEGKCTWVHRMRNTRDHAEIPEVRAVIGLDDSKPPTRKRWSHGIKQLKDRPRAASWGRTRSKSKASKEGSKTPELIEEDPGKLAGRPTV